MPTFKLKYLRKLTIESFQVNVFYTSLTHSNTILNNSFVFMEIPRVGVIRQGGCIWAGNHWLPNTDPAVHNEANMYPPTHHCLIKNDQFLKNIISLQFITSIRVASCWILIPEWIPLPAHYVLSSTLYALNRGEVPLSRPLGPCLCDDFKL